MPPTSSNPSTKTVGYIGLGNAGFSMASNLPTAGYNLIVHDADASKAQKAASGWQNTTASNGEASAFADCEVIITMLPQGKIVREVLLGDKGIAAALKPGTIIVDTSSSSPFDTASSGQGTRGASASTARFADHTDLHACHRRRREHVDGRQRLRRRVRQSRAYLADNGQLYLPHGSSGRRTRDEDAE